MPQAHIPVNLPDRWILAKYLRMLTRVLHAARSHAKHSHPTVVQRLTECIAMEVPDCDVADDSVMESYLNAVGQTVVATRYPSNAPFAENGQPYRLVTAAEPGADRIVFPGCEAALSLLDVVDNNFTNMLMSWNQPFWCRPRQLYEQLRQHETEYESGLARFTGFLQPVDIVAPTHWECDPRR